MNLKELSQLLNLSQTTVSRALNGYPEVSETTRQRVMEAARQHGYQPNAAARRLATGKANAIGCVAPHEMSPRFMEFLAGVTAQAAVEGLDVVLGSAGGAAEDACRRLASHGQVDAIFLFCPDRADPQIDLLGELDLPSIVFGDATDAATKVALLDIDDEAAAYNAARLLVQLGHRSVALIEGTKTSAAARREAGARRALEEAGAALPRALVLHGDLSERSGYQAAGQLLDSGDRPTALLCASLFAARGLERAAAERGLKIGADLSVIAHDDGSDHLGPETFGTPLTTTRAPLRKAGARVAERLHARIKGVEKGPKAEIWPAELIVRASIAPPRG